jgi:tRNA C32,U32 (ribose-2'-O)-methylase TrmJ
MKPTLSELWRGEIHPIEDKTEADEEEIRELNKKLEAYYTILWNKLDTDGKQVLDRLRTCHTEISLTEAEVSFIKGFSLAVKMMTEAISE